MKKWSKKLIMTTVLAGLMVCLGACGKKDAVKDDLCTYINNMEEAQQLQQEAINAYNIYVNDSELDSQELLTALNDTIIPKYSQYLDAVNALAPETEEVINIKLTCVEGANKQYAALNRVKEAIEACDSDLLIEADTLIQESVELFNDYETQLNALAAEHEITLLNASSVDGNQTDSTDGSTDNQAE